MADVLNNVINKFCDLILIYNDNLEFSKFESFINAIIENKLELVGERYVVREIVRNKVNTYTHNCTSNQIPFFSFASDGNYNVFRNRFEKYYRNRYREIYRTDSTFPAPFDYAFDFIQETIDSHTLFEEFSIQMTKNAVVYAKKEALEASESAMMAAKVSAKVASNAASQAAGKAAEAAIEQVVKDKKLEGYAKTIIDNQINRVSKSVSETSVTILGIFAGIVLTVVAGLFYSSSVINNINTADFYRLISTSALVGVVCFDLLALMFHYIERIRSNGETKASRFTAVIIFVNVVFIGIMCYYSTIVKDDYSNNILLEPEKSVYDVNISMADMKKKDNDIEASNFDDLYQSEAKTKTTDNSDLTKPETEKPSEKSENLTEHNKNSDGN